MLDLREIVRALEQTTGIRSGFPTSNDYARFRHVVELDGLCRDKLGDARFRAAYRATMDEAVRVAPLEFIVEPVRDGRHVVVGYEFGFAKEDTATDFGVAAMAAVRAKGVA